MQVPAHDVVVTNPPYSGKHLVRVCVVPMCARASMGLSSGHCGGSWTVLQVKLLQFLQRNGKPFLLILPEYVHAKEYFYSSLGKDIASAVCYLTPYEWYTEPQPAVASRNLVPLHGGPYLVAYGLCTPVGTSTGCPAGSEGGQRQC